MLRRRALRPCGQGEGLIPGLSARLDGAAGTAERAVGMAGWCTVARLKVHY